MISKTLHYEAALCTQFTVLPSRLQKVDFYLVHGRPDSTECPLPPFLRGLARVQAWGRPNLALFSFMPSLQASAAVGPVTLMVVTSNAPLLRAGLALCTLPPPLP